MKEILKYLRQLHSFTQDEIARKIGISRQWYIKLEKGLSEPSEEMIEKFSKIYDVSEDFIRKNQIPKIEDSASQKNAQDGSKYSKQIQTERNPDVTYRIEHEMSETLAVAEPEPGFSYENAIRKYANEKMKMYYAFFDGKNVKIQNPPAFRKGEKFKIFIEKNEDEDLEERKKSFERMMEIVKKAAKEHPYKKSPDDDPFYKEELYEALEEKYGIAH